MDFGLWLSYIHFDFWAEHLLLNLFTEPSLKNYNLTTLYSSEFYGFCENMSIWKL